MKEGCPGRARMTPSPRWLALPGSARLECGEGMIKVANAIDWGGEVCVPGVLVCVVWGLVA